MIIRSRICYKVMFKTCAALFIAAISTLYESVTAISSWNTVSAVTTEILLRIAVCTDGRQWKRCLDLTETKSAPKSQGQDLNICRREHGGQGHVSRLYTV